MATIYRAVFQVAGPSVRLAASSLFEEWIGCIELSAGRVGAGMRRGVGVSSEQLAVSGIQSWTARFRNCSLPTADC